MSSHPIPTAAHPLVSAEPNQGSTPLSITLRWIISRRAAAQFAPKGTDAMLHLELRINPTKDPRWIMIDPTTNAQRTIEHPEPAPSCTLSETSLELESPSLCAHIGINDQGEHTLVYVRTTIFADLNIPGGRYEPINARVFLSKRA